MKRNDNIFDTSGVGGIDRSTFDLSHSNRTTYNMGELIPIACIEVLPGDSFNIDTVNMLRFQPLVAPVMDKVTVQTDFFFVPLRILYKQFEEFITGVGVDGPTVGAPYVVLGEEGIADITKNSIASYLGLPSGDYSNVTFNVSPMQVAAYYKIYDEWYRAQNFIEPKLNSANDLVPGDNTDVWADLILADPLRRAWEHDYFTSALPTAQQYDAGVSLPLTFQDDVPVEFKTGAFASTFRKQDGTSGNPTGADLTVQAAQTSGATIVTTQGPVNYDPNGSLVVDIQADAASINDLRQAWSLQVFLERSLRGGLRYIEQIWTHFRKKSSDARLQRPEMLGRRSQMLTVSEVLATAQDTTPVTGIPLGTMAGHGISVGSAEGINYTAEEHGFIMIIRSVMPDTAYSQGVHKQWSRLDRLDYAWPSFAHIGEQTIKNKEVFAIPNDAFLYPPEGDWGYIPRYDEYRYLPSRVSGDFNDNLQFWTLGRRFDPLNPPALNSEFIESRPRTDIFAITDPDVDHVLDHTMLRIRANRPLPRNGVPGNIGNG